MRVHWVDDGGFDALLHPDAAGWAPYSAEPVAMMGTPIGLQPTAAIQAAWMGKKIGAIDRAQITAVHDGEQIAFRLEWADPSENAELADNDSFPDAAAILLPAAKGAPLMTMGAPDLPVNAWYWRADEPNSARHLIARGIGTSHTFDRTAIAGSGVWKAGRWRVVLARSLRLEGAEPMAQLQPGTETGVGVAIWEGGSSERGGIKSFSGDWLPLQLEAAKSGRLG